MAYFLRICGLVYDVVCINVCLAIVFEHSTMHPTTIISKYTKVHIYICIPMYTNMYKCMYVYMHVCIYFIFAHMFVFLKCKRVRVRLWIRFGWWLLQSYYYINIGGPNPKSKSGLFVRQSNSHYIIVLDQILIWLNMLSFSTKTKTKLANSILWPKQTSFSKSWTFLQYL